jgi:D-alanyl-D-alanine carboxypeptidase/D-alanyl-D-alanine-endopeptidase (penicillin-binding protein 4)
MKPLIWALAFMCVGCGSVSRTALNRTFRQLENTFQHHVGFELYDPQKQKVLYSYRADRYFTPASNTKVLTFYTALQVLGDSVPAMMYQIKQDSLIFCGTADPSFLYARTHTSSKVYNLLQNFSGQLYLADNPMYSPALGPGWAWSDYLYSYSVERAAFPIYGNYFTVTRRPEGRTEVNPPFFKKFFRLNDSTDRTAIVREWTSNRLDYAPARITTRSEQHEVPFKPTPTLIAQLLEDTLKKRVEVLPACPLKRQYARLLYSVPADSLYKTMMQESDNFISEQLLMMCAWLLTDSLKPEAAISYALKHYLSDLPDKPVWVDGSGLSRYNLNTPRNMVALWEKIYRHTDHTRLFALLPAGGVSGTLRNWYKADNPNNPYIFGKTGTLSNNHCLSGFLITRKNRILIFSFMNSHYVAPVNQLRREMENILKTIHDKR